LGDVSTKQHCLLIGLLVVASCAGSQRPVSSLEFTDEFICNLPTPTEFADAMPGYTTHSYWCDFHSECHQLGDEHACAWTAECHPRPPFFAGTLKQNDGYVARIVGANCAVTLATTGDVISPGVTIKRVRQFELILKSSQQNTTMLHGGDTIQAAED